MRERIDKVLVIKKLAPSREKAIELIEKGLVLANKKPVLKPSTLVDIDENIELLEEIKYVSRAGYKLEGALEDFNLNVYNFVCLDIGSSTGGFIDCLVQKGAKEIIGVDVGSNQIDQKIKALKNVKVFEKTDIRDFKIEKEFDLITCDISFISLTKVANNIKSFMNKKTKALLLIKPQFELSPKYLRKGIVKLEEHKKLAINTVANFYKEIGFKVIDIKPSRIKGAKGNEEFFMLCTL